MVQTRSARKAEAEANPTKKKTTPKKLFKTGKKTADADEPAKPWTTGRDGLYPTVALSDFCSATAHAYASYRAYEAGAVQAAAGFALVVAASLVGVLRFGYSEKFFAQANGDLADLAAYLGLPLVGFHFASTWAAAAPFVPDAFSFAVFCSAVCSARRSAPEAADEVLKILFNVGAFVVPVAGAAHAAEDKLTLAAIATFVIAAVPIGPDRHACLLGVRKENIFHYLIGAAAIMFAEAF